MTDARVNFATSLVATAPSPATSGTSLVVTGGEGARFPAVSFNAVVCPASQQPTSANAEIVRVTARSTDTLTITRAQESTSARTIVVGDRIFAGMTKKDRDDIDADMLAYFTASVPKTFFNAKGDLVSASANDTPALVTVGANGTSLEADSSQSTGVKWTATPTHTHSQYDRYAGVAGVYAPAWIPTAGNVALTASRAYFMRTAPTRDMTITSLAFLVTTFATSDDTVDVGYYTYSGSTLTKVAAVGATTGKLNTATGVKTFTGLSWALTAGTVYYIAMAIGTVGGTPANVSMAGGSQVGIFDLVGTALGATEAVIKAATNLSSATVTSLTTGAAAVPIIALRE